MFLVCERGKTEDNTWSSNSRLETMCSPRPLSGTTVHSVMGEREEEGKRRSERGSDNKDYLCLQHTLTSSRILKSNPFFSKTGCSGTSTSGRPETSDTGPPHRERDMGLETDPGKQRRVQS